MNDQFSNGPGMNHVESYNFECSYTMADFCILNLFSNSANEIQTLTILSLKKRRSILHHLS